MKFIIYLFIALFSLNARADIFEKDDNIIGGLHVLEMSDVFSDIYQNLDNVKWAGKDIRIAIESIENISKDIHIAATDQRIVVLHLDTIIGNWPRPKDGDFKGFGQVTTAIVLKLRDVIPTLGKMDEPAIYKVVVSAIMKGVDENGKYIYSKKEQDANDPHVLTSLGIAGVRDSNGNYVLNTIFKGSSAEAAGLEDSDILISANGAKLKDLSDMEVLGLFNGFSNGTIKIKAVDKFGQEKSVSLRRASIVVADADILALDNKNGKVLQIVIHKITDNAVEIVSNALDKYKDNVSGIYLDLRGATGDDEITMAKIAGLFLGKVPVARMSAISEDDSEIVPGGDSDIEDIPMVISVSNSTKGTAEGLAYAFYENNTGVIIGMPTAGISKLATKINLKNGGTLEVLNREMKSGLGKTIDGRGFFPIVCLSNIRTSEQADVFLVSVKNHEWNAKDFNADDTVDRKTVLKGCPNITSGSDEDNVSMAVAMDIMFDKAAYSGLKNLSAKDF